jgi:hypothetical protein
MDSNFITINSILLILFTMKNMPIEYFYVPPCNCMEHRKSKRFLKKGGKTEKLKKHAEELKKELAAVEEHEELSG